jgi:hypothetical protein
MCQRLPGVVDSRNSACSRMRTDTQRPECTLKVRLDSTFSHKAETDRDPGIQALRSLPTLGCRRSPFLTESVSLRSIRGYD